MAEHEKSKAARLNFFLAKCPLFFIDHNISDSAFDCLKIKNWGFPGFRYGGFGYCRKATLVGATPQ